MIVNDSNRAGETEVNRAVRDLQRVFRIFYTTAQHRIDIHLKYRVFRQPLEPCIQRLQTF